MLYEFWKKDCELFPSEIIDKDASLASRPHCIVFVFDGSLDDVPNGDEEVEFYRSIIQKCRDRSSLLIIRVFYAADCIDQSGQTR